MIAKLLIWLARGWQEGHSKVLPPSRTAAPATSGSLAPSTQKLPSFP